MNVQPYLSFEGRCQEALDFYKTAIGAQIEVVMLFKDAPPEVQPQIQEQAKNKVMHSSFKVGETQIMATDGGCSGGGSFSGVSLTLNVSSNAEAEKMFAALGQGGKVTMPMSETFFAHRFGTVADKFGVNWMVLAPKAM